MTIPQSALDAVFETVQDNPGLLTSEIIKLLNLSARDTEDAIWRLWETGKIQIEINATLRATRDGEKVFRHFAP